MSEVVIMFEATVVPKARICPLVTEGRRPEVDALVICQELLLELPPSQRKAIVDYLLAGVVYR